MRLEAFGGTTVTPLFVSADSALWMRFRVLWNCKQHGRGPKLVQLTQQVNQQYIGLARQHCPNASKRMEAHLKCAVSQCKQRPGTIAQVWEQQHSP